MRKHRREFSKAYFSNFLNLLKIGHANNNNNKLKKHRHTRKFFCSKNGVYDCVCLCVGQWVCECGCLRWCVFQGVGAARGRVGVWVRACPGVGVIRVLWCPLSVC